MNPNTLWGRVLFEELARCGVSVVCVAPGSRSTPLVLGAARELEGRFEMHVRVDERSAGFFALGVGKATGRPAVVITTSGTAGANLYPAVIEAAQSETPLIVITADRPHALRDSDANQAIDQVRLFGRYPRAFWDLAAPTTSGPALRHLRGVAARAVAAALGPPAGPVHLNAPFAKPLEPGEAAPGEGAAPEPLAAFAAEHPRAAKGRGQETPYVRVAPPTGTPPAAEVRDLARALAEARRPLVVAGAHPPWEQEVLREATRALLPRMGAPLFPDPLSGLRFGVAGVGGAVSEGLVLGGYDLALRSPRLRDELRPDLVLRLGPSPTSASLLSWLEDLGEARQIVVGGAGRWKDHIASATDYFGAGVLPTLEALSEEVGETRAGGADGAWLERWSRVEAAAASAIAPAFTSEGDPASRALEGAAVVGAIEAIPNGGRLFLGSSMPVRDADAFALPRTNPLMVTGNRGASGIDGSVSTAWGVAAAAPPGTPTVAVLGDLTMLHEMNGLLRMEDAADASGRSDPTLVFVVIQNDGGGIFHMLPIRAYEPHFTPYFVTPHGLDFERMADLFGLPFERVGGTSGDATGAAVARALERGGRSIVEVPSQREANRIARETIQRTVVEAVETALD